MTSRIDDYDDRTQNDRDSNLPAPHKKGMGIGAILLIVFGILFVCGGLIVGGGIYGVVSMRGAAERMKSRTNLMQIGLAIQNYNDINGELPGNTYSRDGEPLLSWRVHILPYIEQDNLYRQFKLNEPWDSPNNIRLLNEMPRIYAVPNAPVSMSQTHYRGFSSKGTIFERKLVLDEKRDPRDKLMLQIVPDGTARTLLVIEAGDPVEWTKPEDLDASPGKPFPRLGGFHRDGVFQALMVDGSVKSLKTSTPEDTLRALTTYKGGETLPPDWDK